MTGGAPRDSDARYATDTHVALARLSLPVAQENSRMKSILVSLVIAALFAYLLLTLLR
jgi:hypothetical protein